MDITKMLDPLIEKYISTNDKKAIHHIEIFVPKNKGYFFIIDSFKLNLKKTTTFSLSILFSINHKGKSCQRLIDKINANDYMKDYKTTTDSRSLVYSKDFGLDKQAIIKNVNNIIQILSPKAEANDISVSLKEISDWMTIDEDEANSGK